VNAVEPTALRVDTGTRLAVDRTRLAHERTLMAWVRTAVSMISFGFTIYKFFQYELRDRPVVADRLIGPREFALIMIAIGLVALLLSTVQHRQSMRALRAEYGALVPVSTSAIVAVLFSILGLFALIAVLFRQ
jgi:putative membrane protein